MRTSEKIIVVFARIIWHTQVPIPTLIDSKFLLSMIISFSLENQINVDSLSINKYGNNVADKLPCRNVHINYSSFDKHLLQLNTNFSH